MSPQGRDVKAGAGRGVQCASPTDRGICDTTEIGAHDSGRSRSSALGRHSRKEHDLIGPVSVSSNAD
jgi:hypothetical protein